MGIKAIIKVDEKSIECDIDIKEIIDYIVEAINEKKKCSNYIFPIQLPYHFKHTCSGNCNNSGCTCMVDANLN